MPSMSLGKRRFADYSLEQRPVPGTENLHGAFRTMIYEIKIKLNEDQTAFIASNVIEEDGVCTKQTEHVPFLTFSFSDGTGDDIHSEYNYE